MGRHRRCKGSDCRHHHHTDWAGHHTEVDWGRALDLGRAVGQGKAADQDTVAVGLDSSCWAAAGPDSPADTAGTGHFRSVVAGKRWDRDSEGHWPGSGQRLDCCCSYCNWDCNC